jgi:16S rRNA (guanine527-N7)-methyltransferase
MEQIQQHELLGRYVDLLLEANQQMNLTRIVDRDEAMQRHIADALTLLPFLPSGPHRLADVGSGGGVPGIPLAIVRPDAQVVLIESTRKKAAFLREVVQQLQLQSVQVDDRRAEAVARDDGRESFDVVVVRAVATLNWLAEWCLPLVRVGGRVLAMKGPRISEELPQARRALDPLGGAEPVVHRVALEGAAGHVIIEIRKLRPSDPAYPRDPTVAKGKPIR